MIGNERGRCDKVASDGKWKCSLWLQLSASNKTEKSGTFFFVSYLFWRWIFKGAGHKNSFGRSFFMTSSIKSDTFGQGLKQMIKSVQQRLYTSLIADIQQDACLDQKEAHVLYTRIVHSYLIFRYSWTKLFEKHLIKYCNLMKSLTRGEEARLGWLCCQRHSRHNREFQCRLWHHKELFASVFSFLKSAASKISKICY